MVAGADGTVTSELPASWDVSSDSLAVWLATAIGASRVVFIKRARRRADHLGVHELVGDGTLDPFVPRLLLVGSWRPTCSGRTIAARPCSTG